jgi:cell division protein FtsI/penicillin-binding protein 2
VTARSRERGSHAGRPRGHIVPFPPLGLGPQTPVKPVGGDGVSDPVLPRLPDAPEGPGGPVPPGGPSVQQPSPNPAPAPSRPPRSRGSRHRKQSTRKGWLSRKQKLAAVLALVVAAFCFGFANGFGSEASAEPAVQAFLFDWQQGQYAQAAALTDGSAGQVTAELAAAYTDVDATNAFFALKSVTQHGSTAVATFQATVDLAQSGEQWTYTGRFLVTSSGGQWTIHWTPSDINPSLAAGDRLAAVTTFPQRAPITDMNGQPLVTESADYQVGVYPGRLTNEAATAAKFSAATGLDQQQVLGQIQAAPPASFLSLLTLQAGTQAGSFTAEWPKLAKVPGLGYVRQTQRLFDSLEPDTVGQVGTEDSPLLRAEGAAYQPGMTVGQSGLEQTYQDALVGTPTTSIVVVNSAGHTVATLWDAPGHPGTTLQTTLSSTDQRAATTALAAQSGSGEIVAVDAGTGDIRVLASHQNGSMALPDGGSTLTGKVAPGMSFSIVSAAALLSARVAENQPLPCQPTATVGGVTFSYQASGPSTATFASDFATGCGTAFATLSRTLTPSQLTAVERGFGIGSTWHLQVPAFSGSAATASGAAEMAAQAIGQSGVLMSPLGMAMVAAEVDSGVGRAPELIAGQPSATTQAPMSAAGLVELRQLMRLAVKSGAAHAADLPGADVYGQAGMVKTGANAYLSWFVGYRGDLAVAAIETGTTANQAAAALAGDFLKSVAR